MRFGGGSASFQIARALCALSHGSTSLRQAEYAQKINVPVFYVGTELSGPFSASGVGVHRNYDEACRASLMEFAERYVFSSRFLSNPAAPIPAASLRSGGLFSFPAQMVFWDYDQASGHSPRFCESNVSGIASAGMRAAAIAFGIYELVERDAFLRCWLSRTVPSRLDLGGIDDGEIVWLIEEARDCGLHVEILDLTSDIPIPTFMVVFLGTGSQPPLSRGFSSNLDPRKAVKKALYEAWGSYIINRHLQMRAKRETPPSPLLPRTMLWLEESSRAQATFLFEGPRLSWPAVRSDDPGELAALTAIFDCLGPAYELYYYEPDHVLVAALGIHVVRVFCPGLIPFYLEEAHRAFAEAHPRLKGVVLNEFPHPFA